MKIYFTCSARGTEEYGDYYKKIYQNILKFGHDHLSNYLAESDPGEVYNFTYDEKVRLYEAAINSLKKADAIILEVSTHSLSMGYLMNRALAIGKPVIALYLKNKAPAFAFGIEDEKLQLVEYDKENLDIVLQSALEFAQSITDVRFNFFISPKIGQYLDWISQKKKIPRSVYLRDLIEKDISDNEEYQNA